MRCTLVLVRHGESRWNIEGRWQGHDGPGLTARGRRQAEATAGWIAARYGDVRLLARSDLARAAETAAPLEADLDVTVIVDRRLRELDIGAWAGLTRTEVAERDPAGYAAWLRGDEVVLGGGEHVGQLRARVAAALADVRDAARRAGGGTALVVTHGGCVRAAACLLDGDGPAWRELPAVGNASVTELCVDGPRMRLVRWASSAHLDGLADGPAGAPPALRIRGVPAPS